MENRCDRYRNDTNITGYGFMAQPRTEYQYLTHSRIKFHCSALLSTEFDTGSKHVGCGSGEKKTLIGYFERRLNFLYSSSSLVVVVVVVMITVQAVQRTTVLSVTTDEEGC